MDQGNSNKDNDSIQRVVYDERPRCGRCGAGIIGVVPTIPDEKIAIWQDYDPDKPLCRECVFELDQLALKPGGRLLDSKAVEAMSPEERAKRIFLGAGLALALVLLFIRIYQIAPLLQPVKPLRRGTVQTDSLTDSCINQLWEISRQLQERNLPKSFPRCPKSGQPYSLKQDEDNITVSCSTPQEHGLANLSVSLKSPIPALLAQGER